MSHKESAKLFLQMVATGKVKEAYDKFISPNFIHHNLYFKGDRESLMAAMEEASKQTPNKRIDIKKIYEDGDTVITHSEVVRENPNLPSISVVHIFRFENKQVAELWDVGAEIPKDLINEKGAF
jgi:predicted SnoaL-like aldol condensation-catalyzing enzyme